MTATRGTTNRNVRGSSTDRRRRREWLVATYRADVDVAPNGVTPRSRGEGEPACRCYRCGRLLTTATVSPDRIIPGCEGGTYRRDNIRPACVACQMSTGGALGASRVGRRPKPNPPSERTAAQGVGQDVPISGTNREESTR